MTQTVSPDIHAAIQTVNQQFMAALAQGDAQTAASLYTEDSELLPAGRPEVRGRAAIQAFWQAALDLGVTGIDLTSRELQVTGKEAYEIGRFTLHATNSDLRDDGKYMVIWRQVGGQWRLHRDIFNSSRRPGQPAGQQGGHNLRPEPPFHLPSPCFPGHPMDES